MPVVVKSSCSLEIPRELIVFADFVCLYRCSSPTHRDFYLIGGWSTGICVLKAPQIMLFCRQVQKTTFKETDSFTFCFPDVAKWDKD